MDVRGTHLWCKLGGIWRFSKIKNMLPPKKLAADRLAESGVFATIYGILVYLFR
jgi:hypothetical protein